MGIGSAYFAARNAGSAGSPAALTITFGDGIVADDTFYLIINSVQYSISFGIADAASVPIYQDNEGNLEAYSADYIANAFRGYITSTFSSSLTVTQPTANVVILTTKATGPTANLNASCVLPIFPTVPLGTQVNITLRKTSGFASSYPDNYKLYSGGTLLYNSDWDYTADLVWSNVTVSTANTLTIVTTLSEVEANNPFITSLTNNTCGAVINKSLPYGLNDSEPFNLTSFTSNGNVQINFTTYFSP